MIRNFEDRATCRACRRPRGAEDRCISALAPPPTPAPVPASTMDVDAAPAAPIATVASAEAARESLEKARASLALHGQNKAGLAEESGFVCTAVIAIAVDRGR